MFCPNCGKEMNEGAEFCNHCGWSKNKPKNKKNSNVCKLGIIVGILLVLTLLTCKFLYPIVTSEQQINLQNNISNDSIKRRKAISVDEFLHKLYFQNGVSSIKGLANMSNENIENKILFGQYFIEKKGNELGYLEWDIVHKDQENHRALLMTHNIIDAKTFDENATTPFDSISFENSSLCQWLNNDFYNIAFNNDEKQLIVDNPDCGNNKVFILSSEEMKKYFDNAEIDSVDGKNVLLWNFRFDKNFVVSGNKKYERTDLYTYQGNDSGFVYASKRHSYIYAEPTAFARTKQGFTAVSKWEEMGYWTSLNLIPESKSGVSIRKERWLQNYGMIDDDGNLAHSKTHTDDIYIRHEGYKSYWLRDINWYQNIIPECMYVDHGGTIRGGQENGAVGCGVPWSDFMGVRPAIWVKYDDSIYSSSEIKSNNGVLSDEIRKTKQISKYSNETTVDSADVISFGLYPNYDISGIIDEPLKWVVIDKQNGKALIMTKDIIDYQLFSDSDDIEWKDTRIRKWLNEDFINKAFSDDEKNKILDTKLNNNYKYSWSKLNSDSDTYEVYKAEDTIDKVFLLSTDEIIKYFYNNNYNINIADSSCENKNLSTKPTSYASNIKDNNYGTISISTNEKKWNYGNSGWALRSMSKLINNEYESGALGLDEVMSSGRVGTSRVLNHYYGIRPAMWVSYQ